MRTMGLAAGVSMLVLAVAAASAAHAQETTGGAQGRVTGPGGAPIPNATVTITHVPTGTVSSAVTSANGYYTIRGLRPGGPYVVSASSPGAAPSNTQVQTIGVGSPVTVDVSLDVQAQVQELVVTASAAGRERNGGPTSRFTLADVQNLPSLKRDLRDVARINPFVSIDPANQDALSAGGANNRFNSLTIDGVKQNDDFGVNTNGYPTQRSPISTEAVQAMAVNIAPYSVTYNDFTGANVNAVTKSGTNEVHGSVYGEKTNDNLIGDSIRGVPVINDFSERTWGATLGGPLVKDKVFVFLSYEDFKATKPFQSGPIGSGRALEIGTAPGYITSAQVTAVENTLASVYGYSFEKDNSILAPSSLVEKDRKALARMDWNITENHRLALTYQDTDGSRPLEGIRATNSGAPRTLPLKGNYYDKSDHLRVFTAQLNSQWTDNLRTELVGSRKKVVTGQDPLGGCADGATGTGDEACEMGQFEITLSPTGAAQTVIDAGPDRSRHANELSNTILNFRGRARYTAGAHEITAGAEWEKLDIFNLFLQDTEGRFEFNSLADFQNRIGNRLRYQNTLVDANGDGFRNERDAAAAFAFSNANVYLEDRIRVTPELSLTGGLRYQAFRSADRPFENTFFRGRYGFSNTENLNGRNILLPRFSFEYRPEFDGLFDNVTVSGGVGLFSGGTPTVWISNNYSTTGALAATIDCRRGQTTSTCPQSVADAVLNGATPSLDIPTSIEALLDPASPALTAIRRSASVNALDQNFKLPSTWKANLALQSNWNLGPLGDDWRLGLDALFTEVENGLTWIDYRAGLVPVGRGPDGRPLYRNGAQRAAFLGVPGTDAGTDIVLANTKKGHSRAFAVSIGKTLPYGFDLGASFTYTRAWDINGGLSSVAFSSYTNVATYDINNPKLSTSSYEIRYSGKLRLSWSHAFFGDNKTTFSLFAERRSGLPFSYVFNGITATGISEALNVFGDAGNGRQLLYVPKTDSSGAVTATSDPVVTYDAAFNVAAFNAFIQETGLKDYAGSITPRNEFRAPSVTRIDVRLSQEIPAFVPRGSKLTAYMDIINLGNLLNDKWGVLEQVDFPYNAAVVDVRVDAQNRYIYSNFRKPVFTTSSSDGPTRSLWQIKFGLKYAF